MLLPYDVPPSHVAALHAIQQIVSAARPPDSPHLPRAVHGSEWRCAATRMLCDFAASEDGLVVVPEPLSISIHVWDTVYKLMSVRERKAPHHVSYRTRLRTNRHKWLIPAANQQTLFGPPLPQPGSDEMPVPLSYDSSGDLYVGWPDEVGIRGVGWGLVAAKRLADVTLITVDEPMAPAPDEDVPPLAMPPLKKVDIHGA